MLSMIGHALFGLIVGVVAKFLLPGHDPGGLLVTALIGMVGGGSAACSVARWDVRRRASGRIRHVGDRRDGLAAGVPVYCVRYRGGSERRV